MTCYTSVQVVLFWLGHFFEFFLTSICLTCYLNYSSVFCFKVLKDGLLNGAAVLGVPVKATIKEVFTSC